MVTIRPCAPNDYEAVARIQNAIKPEPTTAAEMKRWDDLTRTFANAFLERVVAENERGEVVGHGVAEHSLWHPDGLWLVKAMVAPEARGRGIGRAIYERVKQVAVEHGAITLETWVEGHDDDSFAWALRRGFYLERQRTESVLDLTRFDFAPFAGAMERVEGSGLRLAVTSVVDDELLRQVWEVDCATTPDVPCVDPDEKLPSFEEYARAWRDDPSERIVAGCFDDDRLVGVSLLLLPVAPGGGAYTGFTGVYREYRGRGIALAIKLLTIREAIARGIPHMRTNNDPDNPSMLAVNEKLGYRLIPGPRRMRLSL